MGNQTQNASRFEDQHQWLTIAKNDEKQLIQNKLSREIVEKHRLTKVQPHHVRYDSLVYDWRKESKTAIFVVEILQMRHCGEDQNRNFWNICQMPEAGGDLLIYTENILKLYQMNPKIQLDEGDEVGIFQDIIEGLNILAQKFGEFIPSKDSVGYNAKKRGKVWINDNFCRNNVQFKREVTCKQDRSRWQFQVIQTIVDICKLCTTDKNYRNNKFYYLLETIKAKQLYSFAAVRQFQGPERKILAEKKKYVQKETPKMIKKPSREADLANSQKIASSNQFITTLDTRQKKLSQDQFKMVNKTFDVPLITVFQPIQAKPAAFRTTYNQQGQQQIRFTHKQERLLALNKANHKNKHRAVQQHATSFVKPQQEGIRRHNISSYVGQKDFNIRVDHPHLHRQNRQKPAHYAQLEELYQSRSSRSQSKMVKKETIKMIDSMEMIENRHEYDHSNGFHKMRNTVLQESIILRAAKR